LRFVGLVYSTIDAVKAILQVTESDWDTEIENCIVSADSIVDSLLKVEGFAIPEVVPQNLRDADAHFAARVFRRSRDPVGAEAFWTEGQGS
jgi:hypothetical protein